jgi:hypothetical protein
LTAYLPFVTPEESMEMLRLMVKTLKNSMVNEGTYEIDWDENYAFPEPIRMIQV